jgi:hypothetical protein
MNKLGSDEKIIQKDAKNCPICLTEEWMQGIRCNCHRICKNGHEFRVEGW